MPGEVSEWMKIVSELTATVVVLGLFVWLLVKYIPGREDREETNRTEQLGKFLAELQVERDRHDKRTDDVMAASMERHRQLLNAINEVAAEARAAQCHYEPWDGLRERRRATGPGAPG